MTKARIEVPIEVYAFIPTIVALASVGLIRDYFVGNYLLLAALAYGAFVLTQGPAILILMASVLIEKFGYEHPIVSYGVGAVIGLLLLIRLEPTVRSRVAIFLGAIFTLGLFPLLTPLSAWRWVPLVVLVVTALVVSLCWLRKVFQLSEVAVFPHEHFDPEIVGDHPNVNIVRFHLHLVFFLVLGSAVWGQMTELLDFRAASVAHLFIAGLVPAAFLAILQVPFRPLPRAVAVQVGPTLQDHMALLARLEAERLLKERQHLLARERAFFLEQPWDQLSAAFTNNLETVLPDGTVMNASDHLFMGVVSKLEGQDVRYEPVLLQRRVINDHVHILGGTGSGKTSLGIMPLMIQLIRGYALRDENTGRVVPSDPVPIVIFDLKGDRALLQTAKEEARARGQEFLFFTAEPRKTSFYFNPFIALRKHRATPSAAAQQLMDGLALNHGEAYGKSFFTRISRQALLNVLRPRGTPQSIKDLYDDLKTSLAKKKGKSQQQAEELLAALEGLIDYPQLFTTAEQEQNQPDDIIDFDRVLKNNQVVYFWLNAPTQSMSVREIGKLALYSFFMAAVERQSSGHTKQAYLIIDEFQRVVGENLAQILEQARSFGISAILANQNIAQLDTHDARLWSLVNSNVRASLHFGSGDMEEKKLLSAASGEVIDYLQSSTHTQGVSLSETVGSSSGRSESSTWGDSSTASQGTSTGWSQSQSQSQSESKAETLEQFYRPRLRIEDISEWFNEERRFLLWVRRGSGYSNYAGRPIKVEGRYAMDEFTYKKRKELPWPDGPRPGADEKKDKLAGPSRDELLAKLNNFSDDEV